MLIISPNFHCLGGVSNHYLGLSSHWTFDVKYIFYGKRNNYMPVWKTLLFYPYDYIRTLYKLLLDRIDVVVINPSLRRPQLIRDGLFLLLARACKKPVVTFIHGFDESYAKKKAGKKGLFQWCYNKSLFIYTLCSDFELQLRKAGIKCPILLTSTKVSTRLLEGVNVKPRKSINNILFVARINKEKGIFIALQTFELLKKKYAYLSLTICGDGPALSEAKKYVEENDVRDVIFRGNIANKELRDEYLKGDIYMLPTTWGEGMATSVLEAMAFGLPIVTRPKGGVVDFFTSEMGFLVESLRPRDYASIIDLLIQNSRKIEKISAYNIKYAREHFMADKVTAKFERDIESFYNKYKL